MTKIKQPWLAIDHSAIRSLSDDPVQATTSPSPLRISGVILRGQEYEGYDGITTIERIRSDLEASTGDVVLDINSPGGTVSGIEEIHSMILAIRATGRRVTVRATGMLASAAYYIASAADKIVAEPSTIVGSIGTYAVLADTTGMYDAFGVKLEVVSTGPQKGLGADGKITPALREDTQRTVNNFTNAFKSAIMRGRNMEQPVVDAMATGETWLANEAKSKGLIDEVSVFSSLTKSGTPKKGAPMSGLISAELADIISTDPTFASVALDAAKVEGATISTIKQAVADAKVVKERGDLQAQVAALGAERDSLKSALAEANAKLEKLTPIASGAARDPGGTAEATVHRSKMSDTEKSKFIREHGRAAFEALPQ